MPQERPMTEKMRRFLKTATRNQIEVCGGLEAAASWTRVGKTELGYYQSHSHLDRFMPIDVAADLTIATGSCALFNELVGLNGCACMPSPRNPVSLCADFKAFGEYVSAAFQDFPAVLNGEKLEGTRIARLDRDLELVIDAAMNARAALRTLSEGESPSSLPCANGGIPRERTE